MLLAGISAVIRSREGLLRSPWKERLVWRGTFALVESTFLLRGGVLKPFERGPLQRMRGRW